MKILLRDLTPGTEYAIQLRTDAGDSVSEWSRIFSLGTMTDNVAPDVPSWITPHIDAWKAQGDTFVAQWEPLNLTLPQNLDFDHYELVLSDGTTEAAINTQNTAHVLTFDQNISLFGVESATVDAKVCSVDASGNKSAYTDILSATNPAPGPPTAPAGGVATEGVSEVALDWVEPAGPDDTDVVRYRVYVGTTSGFTPGPTNIVYSGLNTQFIYKTATAIEHFFKIVAVDKFSQESTHLLASGTPETPFGGDSEAPDEPTDLAGVITNNPNGIGASVELSWTQLVAPADLAGFYVRYREVSTTVWSSATFTSDDRDGVIILPKAYVNYEFQIKSFDWANNESDWAPVSPLVVTSPSNTVPSTVTGLVGAPGIDAIRWTWNSVTDADLKNYEFQISEDVGFTVGVVTFLTGTSNVINTGGLDAETQYWARVRARDTQDAVSAAWSTVATTTTLNVTEDMIPSLSVSKLTAGVLGGPGGADIQVELGTSLIFNGGFMKSNTYVGDVYDDTPTAGWYMGNDGLVIKDGAVSADSFIGGTFNAGDIVLAAGGSISAGTWTLDDTGLDIPDGGISAASLSLQLGSNLMPISYSDFEMNGEPGTAFFIDFVGAGTATPAFVTPGRFNTQALQVTFTNAAAETNEVYLSPSDDQYNISVEPGETYIFSGYFWTLGGTTIAIKPVIHYATGSIDLVQTNVTTSHSSPSAAVRFTSTFTAPAGVYAVNLSLLTGTVGTSLAYRVDGVMVEHKTSFINTPSVWNPGAATHISGGLIKTGAIVSSNFVLDDTSTPMWSISLDGAATFSHLKVLGTSILGKNDTDDQSILQSSNFVLGEAGWMIRGDGVAQFKNVVAGTMNPNVLGGGILGEDPEDQTKYVIELRGALEAYEPAVPSDPTIPDQPVVGISHHGFYSWGLDDNGVMTPFVSFPTTTGKPNIISGELDAYKLTVNNGATLYGANVFQEESTIVLASSVQAPTNAPTVTVDWVNTSLYHHAEKEYIGFTQGHDDNVYSCSTYNYTTSVSSTIKTYKRFEAIEFNNTTSVETLPATLLFEVLVSSIGENTGGLGYNGPETHGNVTPYGMVYVPLAKSGQTAGQGVYAFIWREWGDITYVGQFPMPPGYPSSYDRIKVRYYDQAFNALGGEHTVISSTGNRNIFSLGRDYINNRILVSWYRTDFDDYVVQPWTLNSSNVPVNAASTTFPVANLDGAYLVGLGNFDFGATRWVYGDNTNKEYRVFDTSATPVKQDTENFRMAASVNMRGAFWNTVKSQFESHGYDYKRYTYLGGSNNWLTGTFSAQWRFKYTWWDDNAGGFGGDYETLPSPQSADITMYKRARISVTHANIPWTEFAAVTPDHARIYRSIFSGTWGTYAYMGFNTVGGLTWQMLGTTITPGTAPNTDIATQFPAAVNPAKMTMGTSAFIDGTGVVKTNNPVYKQISHPSTAQTFGTANVWRAVTLQDYTGGVASSRGNISTASVSNTNAGTSTPTIVIAVEGWYHCFGSLTYTNSATAGRRNVRIERFTGTATEGTGETLAEDALNADANAFAVLTCGGMVYCQVGDRLRLVAAHNAPASITSVAGSAQLHVAMV